MPPKIEKEININDLNTRDIEKNFGLGEIKKTTTEIEDLDNRVIPEIRNLEITDKDLHCATFQAPGEAAQGDLGGTILHVFQPIEVIAVIADWKTACSAPNNINIEKCASGVAPGSGNDILASTIALNGTANTQVIRVGNTLTETLEYRRLKYGDRICLDAAGSNPALESLTITIYFKYLNQGNYRTNY